MNDDRSPHDLTEQRLARDLRSAASRMPLAPGSEVAVVANGRRRRHRRRQANAIMLVAVTGIGTAFTIRQLARNGDSSIATDTVPTPDSTGSVPVSAPAPAPTTPASTNLVPVTTEATYPLSTQPIDGSGEMPPAAQIVDPTVVWNVIEPDSTQAVAYGDLTMMASGELPGVILATAPGRNDDYTPQFWQSDDGITWTPVDVDPPFGNPNNVRFGDGVYAVGTAPGIASTQPNPLLFGVSHDDGATWDQIELPVDTNAGHDLPFVTKMMSSASIYPIDGGAVVWLYTGALLDYDAIAAELGVESTDSLAANFTREGVYMPVDSDCTMSPVATTPVFVTPTTVSPAAGDFGGCQYDLVAWDELGVPQETVDLAFDHSPRQFRVIGSDVTELDVPDGVTGAYGNTAEGPLFVTEDGRRWFRMGSDGVLVETPAPEGNGYPLGSNDGTEFVQTAQDSRYGWSNTGIGASTADGGWVYADWSQLAGENRLAMPQAVAVTNAGVVEVLQAYPDRIAEAGGKSVSSGGFTASRASATAPVVITDDATGEEVDLSHVFYGEDGVIIADATGEQLGTMDGPTFQSLFDDPSGGNGPDDFLVAVSADGVNVSVESIPELLGVDASDISSVPRISVAGNTTVIAVTLKERNADGVHRQLVLVGTPIGV